MPIKEIHMKSGKFTYYCDIRVQDVSSGNFLNGETYLSFTGTSLGDNSGNQYADNSGSVNNNSNQTWREELGYGMFAINKGDPNGARTRTIYRTCIACRGTVLCGSCYGMARCCFCNGRGGIITAGYGNYIPCTACGMTGKCIFCNGTGKCTCSQYEYPGYMPGSFMVIGADGQVIYSDNYSSGSSSSSSSSSSRSGVCPTCNGRRYESIAYQYAAASTSGARQPYHHNGGSGCPYCNSATNHYHYPCSSCMGTGRR